MSAVGDYLIEVEPTEDLPYFEPALLYGASKRPVLYLEDIYRDDAKISDANPHGECVVLTVHRSRAWPCSDPEVAAKRAQHVQDLLVQVTMEGGHNVVMPPEVVGFSDGSLDADVEQERKRAGAVMTLLGARVEITQGVMYRVCVNDAFFDSADLESRQLGVFYKEGKALIGFGEGEMNSALYVEDLYQGKLLDALPMMVGFEQSSRAIERKGGEHMSNADMVNEMYKEQLSGAGDSWGPGRLLFPENSINEGAVVDVLGVDGVARGRIARFDYPSAECVLMTVVYDQGGDEGVSAELGVGVKREVIKISNADLGSMLSWKTLPAADVLRGLAGREVNSSLAVKQIPVNSRSKGEWHALYQENPMTSVVAAESVKQSEGVRERKAAHESQQPVMAL